MKCLFAKKELRFGRSFVGNQISALLARTTTADKLFAMCLIRAKLKKMMREILHGAIDLNVTLDSNPSPAHSHSDTGDRSFTPQYLSVFQVFPKFLDDNTNTIL